MITWVSPHRTVAVAVPIPHLDSLTYAVPEHLAVPPVGTRVVVPVGSRLVTGCVTATVVETDASVDLKPLQAIVDDEPLVPEAVLALCAWVADYYLAGIGSVVALSMPPGHRGRASGFRTVRVALLTPKGVEPEAQQRLGPTQQTALTVLAATPSGQSVAALGKHGVTADALARLAARGLVAFRQEPLERDPFQRAALADVAPEPSRVLTAGQAAAEATLGALAREGAFKVALLHGVTGSGKSEVYVRLAQEVRRLGRTVLVLVPEIALTPSVTALFRGAFGTRVAIQHSGLSDGERHDQWYRIRRGLVDVVVGTRSAVFAPLANIGLIVVDEEHDSSYKQEETPRYHGRDVAIVRASQAEALVILGSATPSMESYQHAVTGKYVLVTLPDRVMDRRLAQVHVVDMREEYAAQGPDVVLSATLVTALETRLAKGEQALLLLNRRGFATAVFCRQCGDTFECPNCSVSLTVHQARGGWRAWCHYCNFSQVVPESCRRCAAPYLEMAGFGTETVEQHVRDRFPGARVARLDGDTVRRQGALARLLRQFANREIDVLVGTQMIAKGHDYPNVTLVGVISADVGLGLADFRASERTFQLLTQVVGRAGRGGQPGEAVVQTLYPDHYSVEMARYQDYPAFFARELEYRRGMRYPPLLAMVNVVTRGRRFEEAMQTAEDVARRLSDGRQGYTVLGPAPAPLGRLRGEYRAQLFLKGSNRKAMQSAIRGVLEADPALRRRLTVDVDPLSVL